MAKHEYYAVQGKTLDNIAETMKTVLGVDKDTPIRFDEITNNEKAEQVTENVDAQAEVIEQIKAALNGKSSVGVKEIMDIIDESGVLDSTDGTVTVTEKVEQLIDKASIEKWLWDNSVFGDETRRNYLSNIKTITYIPKTRVFSKILSLDDYFNGCSNLVVVYGLDISGATSVWSIFQGCTSLESVVLENTKNVQVFKKAFYSCGNLKSVMTLNLSSATDLTDMFYRVNKLEEIRFEENSIKISITIPSPVLSDESTQSIIDGLATVETAQTLTLHKNVKAKLTDTQLATITGKNWNLA